MIRHVSCHAILGATQEEVDRLYPDGSCIGYCQNKDCSHGIFGTDQGDGTYDDTFVVSEAQRREREEIVKMVEGMKNCKGPNGWPDRCVACSEGLENDCINNDIQHVINAIKERK